MLESLHRLSISDSSAPSGSTSTGSTGAISTDGFVPHTKDLLPEWTLRMQSMPEGVQLNGRSFLVTLFLHANALSLELPGTSEQAIHNFIGSFLVDSAFLLELDQHLLSGDLAGALSKVKTKVLDPATPAQRPPPPDSDHLKERRGLKALWASLWGKADSCVITFPDMVQVPTIPPFPTELNFQDTIDPSVGFMDSSDSQIFHFDRLRLPDDTEAYIPYGRGLQLREILVRPSYVKLLETITNSDRNAIIIGQEGIGKTSFLIYILLQRLLRGEPTALQLHSDQIWVFNQHGFYYYPAQPPISVRNREEYEGYFPKGGWFLSDQLECRSGLSVVAMDVAPWTKIVRVSDPRDHYDSWCEATSAAVLCMDAWTWDETYALHPLADIALIGWLAYAYVKYRPDAHLGYSTAFSEVKRVEQDRAVEAALRIVLERPPLRESYEKDPRSRTVLAIRTSNLWTNSVVPASPYIFQRLSDKVVSQGIDELRWLYEMIGMQDDYTNDSQSGYLYEIPILRMLSHVGGAIQPRHIGASDISPRATLTVLGGRGLLHFSTNEELNELLAGHCGRGRLWLPTQFEYGTVDAVMVTEDNMVWLIQIVTGSKHGINAKALSALSRTLPSASDGSPWHFLFVVRDRSEEFITQIIYGQGAEAWEGKRLLQFVVGTGPNGFVTAHKNAQM